MTRTVRQPITNLTPLAEGDTVVRKSTDERYRVLAVTPGHVILAHPTSNVERVRSRDMLVRAYEVERPETLPSGLERIGGVDLLGPASRRRSEFRFTDWAGDSARVIVTTEDRKPIVSVSDNPTSVHFDLPTLRHLVAEAEALEVAAPSPTLR